MAYFDAETDVDRPIYIELPPAHSEHGKNVGLLLRHMYGTLGRRMAGRRGAVAHSSASVSDKARRAHAYSPTCNVAQYAQFTAVISHSSGQAMGLKHLRER